MNVLRSALLIVLACLSGLARADSSRVKEPPAFVAELPAPPLPPEFRLAPPPVPSKPSKPAGLFDLLGDGPAWRSYKARFISEHGRVIDTGNKRISHSEGQGYGMLLAVAAGDRDAFRRMWDWTRANLMVRNDSLLAWRWEPDQRPGVADLNDATDGDILVAWALVEAADAWSDEGYRVAAHRIAADIGRRTILLPSGRPPLLLPGMAGFAAEDRADGPIVNLSYFIFPAFPRLAKVSGEIDWARVADSGLELLSQAQFGPKKLPTDWISMHEPAAKPAAVFAPTFSYNAIRIPLYLIWAKKTDRQYLEPFAALWSARERSGLPIVDTGTGRTIDWMQEPGYSAIADLVSCVMSGKPLLASFMTPSVNESYYPATLHLLAIIAAKSGAETCLAQ